MLDFSKLEQCIESLGMAVDILEDCNVEPEVYNLLKAGVVQNFEFTYELSWKAMKRWLEQNLGSTHVDGVTRRELFRIATESKLIDNPGLWFEFHTARNEVSHSYDEDVADRVVEAAKLLLTEARKLFAKLEATKS